MLNPLGVLTSKEGGTVNRTRTAISRGLDGATSFLESPVGVITTGTVLGGVALLETACGPAPVAPVAPVEAPTQVPPTPIVKPAEGGRGGGRAEAENPEASTKAAETMAAGTPQVEPTPSVLPPTAAPKPTEVVPPTPTPEPSPTPAPTEAPTVAPTPDKKEVLTQELKVEGEKPFYQNPFDANQWSTLRTETDYHVNLTGKWAEVDGQVRVEIEVMNSAGKKEAAGDDTTFWMDLSGLRDPKQASLSLTSADLTNLEGQGFTQVGKAAEKPAEKPAKPEQSSMDVKIEDVLKTARETGLINGGGWVHAMMSEEARPNVPYKQRNCLTMNLIKAEKADDGTLTLFLAGNSFKDQVWKHQIPAKEKVVVIKGITSNTTLLNYIEEDRGGGTTEWTGTVTRSFSEDIFFNPSLDPQWKQRPRISVFLPGDSSALVPFLEDPNMKYWEMEAGVNKILLW